MASRYEISDRRAVLASTILTEIHLRSDESVIVTTQVLNIAPAIARNPRKMLTLFDPDTSIVSVFTRDGTSDDPKKIRLSTSRLGPTISRQFPDRVLLTLAACSSAETAFLIGDKPPEKCRTYFFFLPKHPPEKITKNTVVWVESSPSPSGSRRTRCTVKKMSKLASGTMLKIQNMGTLVEGYDIVNYFSRRRILELRKGFVENLQNMNRPFPSIVQSLIKFENHLLSHGSEEVFYEAYARYLKHKSIDYLWSTLKYCAELDHLH